MTVTGSTLTVDVDVVGALPNFDSPGYTVEVWEANPNCGGDNQYAIPGVYVVTDASGNGSTSFTLPYPYVVQSTRDPPAGTGGILGDGVGSEQALVVLDVTQSTGAGDRFRATVPVPPATPNTAPVVDIGTNVTIAEGDTLTRFGSFTDDKVGLWTATVDYGDGSPRQSLPLSGNTFQLEYEYGTAGVYTLEVCVTDEEGATGCTSIVVTVELVQFPETKEEKLRLARRIDGLSVTNTLNDESEVSVILDAYTAGIEREEVTDQEATQVARRMILGEELTETVLFAIGPPRSRESEEGGDGLARRIAKIVLDTLSSTALAAIGVGKYLNKLLNWLRSNRALSRLLQPIEKAFRFIKSRYLKSVKKAGQSFQIPQTGSAESVEGIWTFALKKWEEIVGGAFETASKLIGLISLLLEPLYRGLAEKYATLVESDREHEERYGGLTIPFVGEDIDTALESFHNRADPVSGQQYTGTLTEAFAEATDASNDIQAEISIQLKTLDVIELEQKILQNAGNLLLLGGVVAGVFTAGTAAIAAGIAGSIVAVISAIVGLFGAVLGEIGLLMLRSLHARGLERIADGGI